MSQYSRFDACDRLYKITARLTIGQIVALRKLKKDKRMSITDMLRIAVDDYLEKETKEVY